MLQSHSILRWVSYKRNLLAITCIATAQAIFSPVEGAISGKEAITLRRIAEFWKDGDYAIAKRQIHEFLTQFPESGAKDHLYLMLGDLYLHEKLYQDAYSAYQKIIAQECREQTLFSCLHCLFELKDYPAAVEIANLYFQKEHPAEQALEAHYLTAEALVRIALATSCPEKQKEWIDKVLEHYQAIESSPFQSDFLFAFAELQKMLKNYPLSIKTYFTLAEKYPEKQEDLLFQAATTQVFLDKSAAIETYKKVAGMQGKSSKAATFNYLSLLLETEQYEEMLKAYEKEKDNVPENKNAIMDFYVGASHVGLHQFQEAKEPLLRYIQGESHHKGLLKRALISLVNCAQGLKDLPLLSSTIKEFKSSFPNDSDLAKALLVRAQLSIDCKDLTQAGRDLQELHEQFPSFGHQEFILYTSAVLLSQEGKWQASKEVFNVFLEKYPLSAEASLAQRHLINCAFKLGDKKEALTALEHLLTTQNEVLTPIEKKEFQFLIGKVLYETHQYREALATLEKYINEFPEATNKYEAHLMCANCHQNLQSQPEFFIFHAEKVLSLNPDFINKDLLHLHLFNAYLSMGSCDLQAAEHLLPVFLHDAVTVRRENQLWLTDFYLTQAKDNPESYEIAKNLFNKLLSTSKDYVALEGLLLKFAGLAPQQNLELLKSLVDKQKAEPDLAWKYQRRALFELARAYEEGKNRDQALTLYDQLVENSTHISSYTASAALLHRSRLRLDSLPVEQRNENDPLFSEILNDLKELQIRKNIQSEPIHLEAALDYAKLRTLTLPTQEQNERYLFFLNRIKEDFTSEEDIVSKDYTQSRKQFAEKEKLFQTYMKYTDAEILRVSGEVVKAKEQLQELLSEAHLHPSLKERIQASREFYE